MRRERAAVREPITGRRIKVALVGCGRIAARHLDAFEYHAESCELVAVCDTDPGVLKATVERTGVRGFASLGELLAGSDADLVALATPSGLHAAQTIAVAEAGRHVVTEKPMATRWQDGKAMVAACDAAGVQLFVVKQNRRNATVRLLKEAIDSDRFGRIHMVTSNVFWTRPQEYYDSAPWRGTWEFDGGAFMNQASHYVDLLDWLVGPVESVQAYTATLGRQIEVEDSGVLAIRWRSGALGAMAVTMLTYPSNYEGSLTILGERGSVRLGGVAVNRVEHWEFADSRPEDEAAAKAGYETGSVYGPGHRGYYENVFAALRGTELPETDGREGLHSLELLIATYLAARDGRRVALPLEY